MGFRNIVFLTQHRWAQDQVFLSLVPFKSTDMSSARFDQSRKGAALIAFLNFLVSVALRE
jgi:hypothetical protein